MAEGVCSAEIHHRLAAVCKDDLSFMLTLCIFA